MLPEEFRKDTLLYFENHDIMKLFSTTYTLHALDLMTKIDDQL
jgi:hypothetical protein